MKRPLLHRLKFALHVLFANDPNISTGRQLTSWAWRLGLSFEQSRPFVHLWKNLKQPRRAIQHKRFASQISYDAITREQKNTLHEGFAAFSVNDIPKGAAVTDLLTKLWRERCFGVSYDKDMLWCKDGNDYHSLRNCLKADDLLNYPEVGDFVLSDLFLALATGYLGGIPRLASVMLWWTTENHETKASQLYHRDTEDGRQLKIFINLTDVSRENGPLTFFPASVSRSVVKALHHKTGRLQDSDVQLYAPLEKSVSITGGPAIGMAVDTSNCLHHGSRTRSGERLMLMIQFVPFNVQRESTTTVPLLDTNRYTHDPVRRLISETANSQH